MSCAEEEVAFPLSGEIQGSEVLFDNKPVRILIGEIHGTSEIPPLVAVLVRSLSLKAETVLCLEIAATEQPRLDAFLASDGGDDAVCALLSGQHWLMPDGRASTGYLEMLQLVRHLVQNERRVRVAAIDADHSKKLSLRTKPFTQQEIVEFSRKRDEQMATSVQKVVAEYPVANLVVLVGNVHASVQQGAMWDTEYKPLGWHLKQKLSELISLNYQSSGGQAWVMNGKGVGGPRDFPGTRRGDKQFVELYETTTDGYDGVLYVGRITAAPPAKEQPSTVGDFWERLQQLAPSDLFEKAANAKE